MNKKKVAIVILVLAVVLLVFSFALVFGWIDLKSWVIQGSPLGGAPVGQVQVYVEGNEFSVGGSG